MNVCVCVRLQRRGDDGLLLCVYIAKEHTSMEMNGRIWPREREMR